MLSNKKLKVILFILVSFFMLNDRCEASSTSYRLFIDNLRENFKDDSEVYYKAAGYLRRNPNYLDVMTMDFIKHLKELVENDRFTQYGASVRSFFSSARNPFNKEIIMDKKDGKDITHVGIGEYIKHRKFSNLSAEQEDYVAFLIVLEDLSCLVEEDSGNLNGKLKENFSKKDIYDRLDLLSHSLLFRISF